MKQPEKQFDLGYAAGYRRALSDFGITLKDMNLQVKEDRSRLRPTNAEDIGYGLATLQMTTRHEEMVDYINHIAVVDIINGARMKGEKEEAIV